MKLFPPIKNNSQQGFTLIETVVAILILSLSIGSLLTLAAGGFFSVRYARNQIVADNLGQEALEYVRNSRDTAMLQGTNWDIWLESLNVDPDGVSQTLDSPNGCFADDGCMVDAYSSGPKVRACRGTCENIILVTEQGFYGYQQTHDRGEYPFTGSLIVTTYIRTVTAELSPDGQQLTVTTTLEWQNGAATRTVHQSMLLTNWNI